MEAPHHSRGTISKTHGWEQRGAGMEKEKENGERLNKEQKTISFL